MSSFCPSSSSVQSSTFNPMEVSKTKKFYSILLVFIISLLAPTVSSSGQFVRFGRNGVLEQLESPKWTSFIPTFESNLYQPPSSLYQSPPRSSSMDQLLESEESDLVKSDLVKSGQDKKIEPKSISGHDKRLFFFLKTLFPTLNSSGSKRRETRPPIASLLTQPMAGTESIDPENPNVNSFIRFG